MKRRYLLPTLLFVTMLTACGTKNNDKAQASSEAPQKVQVAEKEEGTEMKEETPSIFTGILKEDATTEDQGVIRLHLSDLSAEKDPDNIVGSFNQDGVILNASQAELAEGVKVEDLKTGKKVRFVLKAPAIMTMSIPPQIPGNSIQSIELLP